MSEWSAMATFLAARKFPRIAWTVRVDGETVDVDVRLSVRSTSKSSATTAQGTDRYVDGVAHRLLDDRLTVAHS